MDRSDYAFTYPFPSGIHGMQLGAGVAEPDTPLEIIHRIVEAYQNAASDNAPNYNSLWQQIEAAHHGRLLSLLHTRDMAGVAKYFENLFHEGILHGIDQSGDQTALIVSEQDRLVYAANCMDRLVAFAEALGCLRVENPEQGRWGENIYSDPDEIVERIEHELGIDISPPEVASGRFGLQTRKGLFAFRDINALYAAWRIRELMRTVGAPAICEIGAGVGRVAYYCHRMGLRNFTIIDLPQINVVQAYFLLRGLPEARIALQSESAESAEICILPFWRFSDLPDRSFDLVLNQDSFPEMGTSAILNYLHLIPCKSRRYLLSINHESQPVMTPAGHKQHVVGQLISEIGGYRREYRFPFWLRRGYVEELYAIRITGDAV